MTKSILYFCGDLHIMRFIYSHNADRCLDHSGGEGGWRTDVHSLTGLLVRSFARSDGRKFSPVFDRKPSPLGLLPRKRWWQVSPVMLGFLDLGVYFFICRSKYFEFWFLSEALFCLEKRSTNSHETEFGKNVNLIHLGYIGPLADDVNDERDLWSMTRYHLNF